MDLGLVDRDLIESADKIVAISSICGQILANVNGIQARRI